MPAFNVKRLYEAAVRDKTPDRFFEDLQEALDKGEVKPSEFSLRENFESMVEGGREIVDQWGRYPEARMNLQENGVTMASFSRINRMFISTEVMASYQAATSIADQLCTTIPDADLFGSRVPGLGQIGDEAEAVGEGKPYPYVGFGEDFLQTPDKVKRGMICATTKEAVFQDKTGLVLSRAREVGDWMGWNKSERIYNVAFGIVATYNRKNRGVVATYGDNSGFHDWDNLAASNALVDWTDIETAELLFDGMVDPNTGIPIMVSENRQIVVPQALYWTARRIVNATEIRVSGSGTETISANPVPTRNIITSPRISAIQGNSTTWYDGDFKKAFGYREAWPITVTQAPPNSEEEFTKDIVDRVKVSECGVATAEDPRYVVKCTQ